jgi:hypothetical protein
MANLFHIAIALQILAPRESVPKRPGELEVTRALGSSRKERIRAVTGPVL